MDWFEKAIEELERELDRGLISQREYNREISNLRHELRQDADDAAEEAYNNVMRGW